MSQFYVPSPSSTPSVPTSFITNDGTAVPATNILNVLGVNGVNTYADPDNGDNLFIELDNGCQVTGQTVGAVTTNLDCLDLGPTAGVIAFRISVAGFVSAGTDAGKACGYFFTGAARTNGVTATIIPTTDKFVVEDASLITADATITTDGNNIIRIEVTGVAGDTIEWTALTSGPFAS